MADMFLVMIVVTSAYFIRGITGFGSGLISVPLLALSFPLTFAIPLVLALDFTASVALGGINRKQVQFGELKILLPMGLIGGAIGVVALLKLPPTPVLIGLGAFTMFAGFRNVFGLAPTTRISQNWAYPAGFAGGVAGAVFGVGSPPYIMYLSRRVLDKGAMRATFSWLISVDGAFRLIWFGIAGVLFDTKLLYAYLLSLIPMAFGLYTGNSVHLDMTSDGMLKAVGTLLVISGAMLFLKSVA